MAAYAREFGMDIVSRLGELFNAFSNELVQIDAKNMKLPHFTKVEVKTFGLGKRYVAASFRGNYWIIQPYESSVGENDIIEYIRNTKSLGVKIANKVIVPLRGLDENSKLLAKELRLAIWDSPTVNTLLDLYGKKRIVIT